MHKYTGRLTVLGRNRDCYAADDGKTLDTRADPPDWRHTDPWPGCWRRAGTAALSVRGQAPPQIPTGTGSAGVRVMELWLSLT